MDGLIDQLCAYIRAADLAARFSLAAFPRLVYADYVEAHGEPDRALAIRLHVRLEERGYPILMPPERSPAPWMKSVSRPLPSIRVLTDACVGCGANTSDNGWANTHLSCVTTSASVPDCHGGTLALQFGCNTYRCLGN